MRTTRISVRTTPAVAAAALLLGFAAPAVAGGTGVTGVSVTSNGPTVRVSTSACARGGTASLLSGTQANVVQGRQITLAPGATQSGEWTGVGSGTYTVVVVCADGTTAGSQSVTVNAVPTVSATTAPAGVRGGLGGGSTDHRELTLAAGAALVAAAVAGTVLHLRRRARPHRH
ncbi:hypothetical protein JNUCC64_31085 [Streptomyces sp. JNUCC 64]